MKTFKYIITEPEGIHSRPAGALVKAAAKYLSSITITSGDRKADAKKIFSVMSLGAKTGTAIEVSVEGEDEETAAAELLEFFKSKL